MNTVRYQYDLDDPLVYKNEMGRYKTERQLSFIRRFLSRESMALLDIGGGGGRLAIPLADLGHRITVIDISYEALALLKTRTGDRVEAIQSDVLTFEYPRRFDIAIAIDSLKYISSVPMTDLFAKVNSLLVMGGIFLIAEINKSSWRNHLSQLLGRRRLRYNITSPEGYGAALRTAGFQVDSMAGFLWMPLAFNSNSPLVRGFGAIEKMFQLGRWVGQSPWLLIAARKVGMPPSN